MEDQDKQFDPLRRLLSLKKHEAPPPGYFNRFPGAVVTRIRMEQHAQAQAGLVDRLGAEAPWLTQIWRALAARPALAGGFGAAVCSLILGGLFLSEKPANAPDFANQGRENISFLAELPAGAGPTLESPLLMAATNLNDSAPQNLFDLAPPFQAAPVSLHPGN